MGKPIIERVYFGVKEKRYKDSFKFPLPFVRTFNSENIEVYSPEVIASSLLFIRDLIGLIRQDLVQLIKQSISFYFFNKPCKMPDSRTYFCIINGEDVTQFRIVPTYEKTKGIENRSVLIIKNLMNTFNGILEFYVAMSCYKKALVQHEPSLGKDE
jgi:hypothetical protein